MPHREWGPGGVEFDEGILHNTASKKSLVAFSTLLLNRCIKNRSIASQTILLLKPAFERNQLYNFCLEFKKIIDDELFQRELKIKFSKTLIPKVYKILELLNTNYNYTSDFFNCFLGYEGFIVQLFQEHQSPQLFLTEFAKSLTNLIIFAPMNLTFNHHYIHEHLLLDKSKKNQSLIISQRQEQIIKKGTNSSEEKRLIEIAIAEKRIGEEQKCILTACFTLHKMPIESFNESSSVIAFSKEVREAFSLICHWWSLERRGEKSSALHGLISKDNQKPPIGYIPKIKPIHKTSVNSPLDKITGHNNDDEF